MSKRNRYACLGQFEDKFDANETAFLEKQLQFVETEPEDYGGNRVLPRELAALATPGDLIVLLGAGSIGAIDRAVLRALEGHS